MFNRFQWIEVKFSKPKAVTAVATQGREDLREWVKSYYLTYSFDGVHFVKLVKNGKKVVSLLDFKQESTLLKGL